MPQYYHGNGSFLRAICLSHTTELEMHSAIDTLAEEHSDQSGVDDGPVGDRSVERMAERVSHLEVSDVSSAYKERVAPIIGAVLKQVRKRHRAMGEFVDEERLQQTLGVMQSPSQHGQTRLLGHRLRGGSVDKCWSHSKKQHNYKGTRIFEHKNLANTETEQTTSR